MNIFVTDPCPMISAQNLCDKRVMHMPREYMEMLAMMIYSLLNKYPFNIPLFGNDFRNMTELYNHPCSRWVRKDIRNSWWLFKHCTYCIWEYERRFNRPHPNRPYFQILQQYIPTQIKPTNNEPKIFRNSSLFKDNEYKDVYSCYKETMKIKWFTTDIITPVWTNIDVPKWAINIIQKELFESNNEYTNDYLDTIVNDELPF